MSVCTMCEERPATTTYGFPVCQACFGALNVLNGELKAMEAEDPVLADLGQKVEQEVNRWMES